MPTSFPLNCRSCGNPVFDSYTSPGFTSESELLDTLWSSHDPISDIDATTLREHVLPKAEHEISKASADLADINNVVALLIAERDRVEAETIRLETVLSKTRGLLSKMRTFPVEIFSQIFEVHCEDSISDVFDTTSGPWVLSQVSRHWRAVVHALPSLWTSFRFQNPNTFLNVYRQDEMEILLDIAISRSRQKPVSLVFHPLPSDPAEYQYLAMSWFREMALMSSRWKSLSLHVGHVAVLALASIGPLSMLQSLRLENLNEVDLVDTPLQTAFTQSSQLCHLELVYVGGLAVTVPLTELRTVTIKEPRCNRLVPMMHEILQKSRHLESLHLDHRFPCDDDDEAGSPLPLVSSSILSLTIRETCCWRKSLFNFTAPNLQSLHLLGMSHYDGVLEFLERSQCPLEVLTLSHGLRCDTMLDHVSHILKLSPSLAKVTLVCHCGLNLRLSDEDMEEELDELVWHIKLLITAGKLLNLTSCTVDFGKKWIRRVV